MVMDDRAMAVCGAAAAERKNSAADCRRLFIVILAATYVHSATRCLLVAANFMMLHIAFHHRVGILFFDFY